jgi:hypothetical protein
VTTLPIAPVDQENFSLEQDDNCECRANDDDKSQLEVPAHSLDFGPRPTGRRLKDRRRTEVRL